MPARARYEPNSESFGAFMVSDQIREPVVEVAKDIAKLAAANATKGRTGNYARGFQVNSTLEPRIVGRGGPRAHAEVYNSDPAAAPQEFGDRWGNPPKRTLRKAGDVFGKVKSE